MGGLIIAEMGDRSQITAVAMAANYGLWTVIIFGCIAHAVAIVVAISIGKILQKSLSERTIKIFGALCFFAFAIYELVFEVILVSEA